MPAGPALLIVGHPGHELRVHGWLETARPIVMVLTDGSGHTGKSRLSSTAALIGRAGAMSGSIFGRLTDVDLYRALLDQNTALFVGLVEEVARAIAQHGIGVVAGDDAEGYNPTHDVCRLVINTGVRLARSVDERPVANLAFGLMDRPDRAVSTRHDGISQLTLDDTALRRKLEAAASYPEMAGEVATALSAWGKEAFRTETFRHVSIDDAWTPGADAPFYERHGANRVATGLYAEVIRYDQHIRPLTDALAARAHLQAQ